MSKKDENLAQRRTAQRRPTTDDGMGTDFLNAEAKMTNAEWALADESRDLEKLTEGLCIEFPGTRRISRRHKTNDFCISHRRRSC